MSTYTYEDDPSYDPSADPTVGTAGYKPSQYPDETSGDTQVGVRGADNFTSNVNAGEEDAAVAAYSDDTGQVRQDEVGDLLSGTSKDETNGAGTRDARTHAFRQEVGLDATEFNE